MQYQNGPGECRGPGTCGREAMVGARAGLGKGQVGRGRVPTEKMRAPEIDSRMSETQDLRGGVLFTLTGFADPPRMLETLCPGKCTHLYTHTVLHTVSEGAGHILLNKNPCYRAFPGPCRDPRKQGKYLVF